MGRYAENTSVPVSRSRDEIERQLERFGATSFGYGWDGAADVIGFEFRNKQVRIVLVGPDPKRYPLGSNDRDKERRRRWRALTMVVKAKLVGVSDGVTTFEQEFLANFVLPSGETLGEVVGPRLDQAARDGHLPPLLPGRS